ncbi:uncharacterized protein ACN427_000812 [Glossina fuscipes fuscipes]
MKFAFAIVLLALAVGVQSSVYGPALAWGGHWGAGWAGPWAGAWHGAPAAVDVSVGAPWGYGAHGAWGGYPGIALSQGPAYAGAHGHGVYVAKTRGAVHTAPLAGHLNSATAVNVAPAPGTH